MATKPTKKSVKPSDRSDKPAKKAGETLAKSRKKPDKPSDKPDKKAFDIGEVPVTKGRKTTIRTGLPAGAFDRLKAGVKTGRPSTYSREVTDMILEKIRQGQSLASICKPDNMPAASTFRLWVAEDVDDLSARSARAYEVGYDAIADQCVEIADTPAGINPTTGATDSGDVQDKRLRIDTRLRLLGKWAPKKYGDKLELGGELKVGVADAVREARERAAKRGT